MPDNSYINGYSIYKHCLVWTKIDYERKLTPKEAKALIKPSGAWMLRNIYDWDCPEQTDFWELINDTPRNIEELPSKVRNQIRRSLRDCDIRMLSKQEIVDADGYAVYRKAFERYHNVTVVISERDEWEADILKSSGFEFWGVFEKDTNKLIAWAMNSMIKGNGVMYNTLKAIPEYMNKHYPYFGLLFEMNRYYLEEKGYSYVSDGFRSVTGHSNIQPFLEKNFLFRKAYCRLKLYYAPWLSVAVKILYPFRHMKILPLVVRNVLNFEEINRQNA